MLPDLISNCQQILHIHAKEYAMELTYRKCGDYYIPKLTLGDTKEYNIGKYGWLGRTYLKKHRPAMYNLLLATDWLMPHLEEVETACQA